jgi:hypothetical protein
LYSSLPINSVPMSIPMRCTSIHAYKVHVGEMHAHEMRAYKVHAYEIHARDPRPRDACLGDATVKRFVWEVPHTRGSRDCHVILIASPACDWLEHRLGIPDLPRLCQDVAAPGSEPQRHQLHRPGSPYDHQDLLIVPLRPVRLISTPGR